MAGLVLLGKCFRNVYLHPLSRFPGPRLAAMGSLYEFWFDVIRDGQYLWQIEKMHDKYGPVIRINSTELHIRDSEYYNSIYTSGGRTINKDPSTAGALAVPSSVGGTIDHHRHRARRGYLNPYFSRRSIIGMEANIYERISRLCERLETSMVNKTVVCLDSAFSALTADIVTQRFYGEHLDYLDIPDYKTALTEAILGVTHIFNLTRFMPTWVSTFKRLPIPIIRKLSPSIADLLEVREDMKHRILNILDIKSTDESNSIMISAFSDADIPPKERDIDRLLDEGTAIILAGTETTSRALSIGLFYLLNDKTHIKKLREDLSTIPFKAGQTYSTTELEVLPYLRGVVHESLRLSFGPIGRLPRVAVNESLQYGNFTIPPGTPVSQSTYFVHTDPAIFPNPHSFNPNRWIKAAEEGFPLNKFLVCFTKGSRQCIAIQMAFTILYLTIARLVQTFDMDLHETTMDAVKVHHVRVLGYPKTTKQEGNGRREIKVKVMARVNIEAPEFP
ncbi:hypothetical protein Purlil1_13680 [Purpureocillium lilacinum]|uniref:Trichodiene oxygenase n=1 Tax=Purpureocillium lilacinum TaxID=33203 RepID=A0ABR0BDG7_PURLI|nr:hypothetical protein Purlil1_13680 [Purpureocillium lilacinum]